MRTSLLSSRIANQLAGAAIAFGIVIFFSFINPEKIIPTGEEPGGGKTISAMEATKMIADFPKWKSSSGQKGGYLSKTALDALFNSNRAATGIFWYMGSDSTGSTFRLIVEPGTSSLNGINQSVPSSIFISETMCPTECGSLG